MRQVEEKWEKEDLKKLKLGLEEGLISKMDLWLLRYDLGDNSKELQYEFMLNKREMEERITQAKNKIRKVLEKEILELI